jgi:hypothetical protein
MHLVLSVEEEVCVSGVVQNSRADKLLSSRDRSSIGGTQVRQTLDISWFLHGISHSATPTQIQTGNMTQYPLCSNKVQKIVHFFVGDVLLHKLAVTVE